MQGASQCVSNLSIGDRHIAGAFINGEFDAEDIIGCMQPSLGPELFLQVASSLVPLLKLHTLAVLPN